MRRSEGGIVASGKRHRCRNIAVLCVLAVSVWSCLSREWAESRPTCTRHLAGNGSLAPMQISPLFLFKTNTWGPTHAQHRMLYRHAAVLTQLCPVLQSGRKCSSCVSDGHHWSEWILWTYEPISLGGLAQMCLWAHQPHDFPCFGQFQGTPELVYTLRASAPLH